MSGKRVAKCSLIIFCYGVVILVQLDIHFNLALGGVGMPPCYTGTIHPRVGVIQVLGD